MGRTDIAEQSTTWPRDGDIRTAGRAAIPTDGADSLRAGNALAHAMEYAPPSKRSVQIAGHHSSVSLEPVFWRALEAAARDQRKPLNALIAEIDAARLDSSAPPNLTSAIRQWLFARALGQ